MGASHINERNIKHSHRKKRQNLDNRTDLWYSIQAVKLSRKKCFFCKKSI